MQIFVSCVRQDRSWAESLATRLGQAGVEVWLDRDLAGGQEWWDTILAHLRSCDAVVAGVSRAYLDSQACRSERAYAMKLGKPVVPVVIEPINLEMLPSDIAQLQFIDYSRPDEAAAFRLIGALFALRPPPGLPDPLPVPPPVPASYWGSVVAYLASPLLTLDQQLSIIGRLEAAMSPAAAPDERQVATEILRQLAGRPDLFASAERQIQRLVAQADTGDQSAGMYPAGDASLAARPPQPSPLGDKAAAVRDRPAPVFVQIDTDPSPYPREPAIGQAAALAPFPPAFDQGQGAKAGEAKVFISYSHRDDRYRQQLETHLSALRRQGVITEWHDHKIMPGEDWRDAIDRNLDAADCVLLLVTPDFIASDYCYSIEMQRALEKHREGQGHVIPVIVRPADWQHTPLRDLEALPAGAKPVIEWARRDRAWLSVAEGVRLALASSSGANPRAQGDDPGKPQDQADLTILEQRARSSGQAGNAASARDQYAALLPVYGRLLGPEHPETLNARKSLAHWTGMAGDLASARDQYVALLPIYDQIMGPEHPATLNIRNSAAWFTGHAGDPASAREQFASLLPTYERVLGPEHPSTLAVRSNLAHFTGAAGDPASARDQYAALLPVMERVLGSENPDTLTAHGYLANWTARARSRKDDTPNAPRGEAANSKLEREIAAMKEFDVPADEGLTRVQASEALKRHGINPKAFGSWVRHGWVIRNGDRRYLSPKGRQWLTDHQAGP